MLRLMDKKSGLTTFGFFAGTVIIILAVTACTGQPPVPVSSGTNPFNKAELKEVERLLNKKRTKRYAYRVIKVQKRKDGSRKLIVTKKDEIHGLLLMRNRKHLRPVGINFYDDRQGNLLRFGGKKKPYGVTYTSEGQTIVAVDKNRDGIVDTAVGSIGNDSYWMLSDDIGSQWPCLSASGGNIEDAALACGKHEDPGSTVGGGGPGSTSGPSLADITEPDCSEKTPLDKVRHTGKDARAMARDAFNEADRERSNGNHVLAKAWEKVGNAALNVEVTVDEPAGVFFDAISELQQSYQDLEEAYIDQTGTLSTSLPPLGEEGVFEDPRCAGQETSASQGLGFLALCAQQARDARGGSPTGSGTVPDFLDCYRQMGSPLDNRTGGRCALGPGTAGGQTMNCSSTDSIADCLSTDRSLAECQREQAEGEGGVPLGQPGGSDAGPTDAPMRPGSRGSVDTRYIDTIPLGAFIAGICSSGGCPDPRKLKGPGLIENVN